MLLNAPAKVVNGYTLVPLRFISESFGVMPQWDGSTSTITINSNEADQKAKDPVVEPNDSTTESEKQPAEASDVKNQHADKQDSNEKEKVSIFDLNFRVGLDRGRIKKVENIEYDGKQFSKGFVAHLSEDADAIESGEFADFDNNKKYSTLEFTIWAETDMGDSVVAAGKAFDGELIEVTKTPKTYTVNISHADELSIYLFLTRGTKIIVADPVVY